MLGSSSPHRRSRTGMWFAAFTVVSLLMLLASRTEQAQSLQQVSGRALEPLRAVVAGVGSGVAGLFGTIGEIDRLRTENSDLRGEVAALRQEVAALEEAARENELLRALLGVARSLDMELVPARVTSRDPSNFTWEVGIDIGRDQGIEPGMPVVAAALGPDGDAVGGLAGTVTEVGPDSARVRFIVDTRSTVVAADQQTGALGVVRGQLGGQLVMVQVRSIDQVERGDAIVSAGLTIGEETGSRYPRGLLIGYVEAVEPDLNALTKTVFVRPAVDFSRLERLLVVLDFVQG